MVLSTSNGYRFVAFEDRTHLIKQSLFVRTVTFQRYRACQLPSYLGHWVRFFGMESVHFSEDDSASDSKLSECFGPMILDSNHRQWFIFPVFPFLLYKYLVCFPFQMITVLSFAWQHYLFTFLFWIGN